MSLKWKPAVFAALFAAFAASGANGQNFPDPERDYPDQNYPDSYSDDYSIRQTVARLSYISGDVAFARGDDPDNWQPAYPNIPMTLGDRAWTTNGRLELQLQHGNLIRMAKRTLLTALNLTEDTSQFSLSAGVASFSLRQLYEDEVFEVDTPNAAITFESPGDYRIDVRPDGDTRLQVRRGRALVASGGGQVPLSSGQAIVIEGAESPSYDFISISYADGWDGWVRDRDLRFANVRSYQYVSPGIAGVEDLDGYGQWQRFPQYGWCWTPSSVAAGWAPYRQGRWIWQDPWGWTWVSTEQWGWAPYHYGRWAVIGSRWYWLPVAPSISVVAYRPALVAFVGGGPGFGVSVGFGSADYVGWFPLGPREPLIPWWGRPAVNVNVNVTNITYVNRTHVTVVNQNTFVQGRVVAANTVRDASIVQRIQRAPVVTGAIPVVPTRESIRVSTRQASAPRPPATIVSRTVVARVAPPPAPPRFDDKVQAIRQNRGAPVDREEAQRIVAQRGQARAAAPVRPATAESGRVELSQRGERAGTVRPEPVRPSRGRELSTREQPVAQQPARTETDASAARERRAQPRATVPPEREAAETRQAPPGRQVTPSRPAPPSREAPPAREIQREAPAPRQAPTAREAPPSSREREAQERATQEREAAQERAAQERATQERAAQERAAQERATKERAAQERATQERAAQERATQERAAQERATQERAARERATQDRAAQERATQERAAQERAKQERAKQERATQERAAQERATQERAAQERAAAERAKATPRAAPEERRERTVVPPPAERAQPRSGETAQPPSGKERSENARPTPERGRGRSKPRPTPTKSPD